MLHYQCIPGMIKKLAAALLVFALMISLGACGIFTKTKEKESTLPATTQGTETREEATQASYPGDGIITQPATEATGTIDDSMKVEATAAGAEESQPVLPKETLPIGADSGIQLPMHQW